MINSRSTATLEDIGRELGISAMTVSRALNGRPDVKEETRRKILKSAARMNYRPNRWARSLVTRKSHIIGIVVPDISHSFFSEITRAVQMEIEKHGYDVMLCHTHGDPARERAAIDMLLSSRVEGLMVASSCAYSDPGIFRDLRKAHTPLVLVDRFFSKLDCACVRTDDVQVGRIATQFLIGLGHRDIAEFRGPDVSTGRLRHEGFLAVMNENGLRVREDWIVESNFEFDGGYEAMKRLLKSDELPTAIFAGNDPSAVGAIRACREAGLTVPRDMSLVGAGSIEASFFPAAFLTTIDWSRAELGRRAAELLLAEMRNQPMDLGFDCVVPPSILERQSTAPPRKGLPVPVLGARSSLA